VFLLATVATSDYDPLQDSDIAHAWLLLLQTVTLLQVAN